MTKYNVLGVNDDRDFCECCGRQGLKRVVWIENTETQEVKHFGTTCAAAPAKGFGLDVEIRRAISHFEARQQSIWRKAHKMYRKLGGDYTGTLQDGFTPNNLALLEECIAQARTA